jgi:hypothetical protein
VTESGKDDTTTGEGLSYKGPAHRSIRRESATLDNTFGHLAGGESKWYMGGVQTAGSEPVYAHDLGSRPTETDLNCSAGRG